MHEPRNYWAIMLSSTFTDLQEHRREVREVIGKLGFKPEDMESHGAHAEGNVIEASLQMVRDSAAYVGVISHKYGQVPVDPKLNPSGLSITELEFNEAMRLNRPILLFIMGDKHPLTKADIETNADRIKKLDAFRERAKRMRERSEVHRVYELFESQQQFVTRAATAFGRLIRNLDADDGKAVNSPANGETEADLPRPPELAALPKYLGSHNFVGRDDELRTLNDWCGEADPNPMLLFEAMGGSGKSMLTWKWLSKDAPAARSGWKGRFWFSFYERGAVMAGFCRQALAYMTGKPVEEFAKLRTPQLADLLIAELDRRPWLLVLDGLERVLVAYQRTDAAQLADEKVDESADPIEKRDPCTAIHPEDDELLRRLAAVAKSKILVTSRLTPHALINRSGTAMPGVRREFLKGLRPDDAELMIRACGIDGNSKAIQLYLQSNCDCHPLVIGALAGLINAYPPDPGNFDRWADDPRHGRALNLSELNLTQRKSHILQAAIDALEPGSRQLLQTLSLLRAGADYDMLNAFNPHLPPEPKAVEEPEDSEKSDFWKFLDADQRARQKANYSEELAKYQAYLDAIAAWKSDSAVRAAPAKLDATIHDLEKRGLLQFDQHERHYDLHPVVRGVAVGRMQVEETQELGRKVVDHFNSRLHDPWERAEALADVEPGLEVVRVLLRMGRYEEALNAFRGDLYNALLYNLDAPAEAQTLLQPFFPEGWDRDTVPLDDMDRGYVLAAATVALAPQFPKAAWQLDERNVILSIVRSNARRLFSALLNLASLAYDSGRGGERARLMALALDLSEVSEDKEDLFRAKLYLYWDAVTCGNRGASDRLWQEICHMERPTSRAIYWLGDAEMRHAWDLHQRGELTEVLLAQAEALAREGHTYHVTKLLHELRGQWHLGRGELSHAVESFGHSVRMARETGHENEDCEVLLTLVRLRAGERFGARAEAERLSKLDDSLAIAELWHELGDRDRAIKAALRAHEQYVGEGEPYVGRYYLVRTRALLAKLSAPLPEVPKYNPSTAKIYPWEKDVRAFIDKMKAERKKTEQRKAEPKSEKTKKAKRKSKPKSEAKHH